MDVNKWLQLGKRLATAGQPSQTSFDIAQNEGSIEKMCAGLVPEARSVEGRIEDSADNRKGKASKKSSLSLQEESNQNENKSEKKLVIMDSEGKTDVVAVKDYRRSHFEVVEKSEKRQKKEEKKRKKEKREVYALEADRYSLKKIATDPDKGFVYGQELGVNLLKINIQKFGDRKLYEYGLTEDKIPQFRRVESNLILGLKQDLNSGLLVDDLNKYLGIKTYHGLRSAPQKVYEAPARISIDPSKGHSGFNEDFIRFDSVKLQEEQLLSEFDSSNMHESERKYLVRTKELNSRMEAEKNNLSFWIQLLEVQDHAKDSIFQGKLQLIVEKKLAIIDKAFSTNDKFKSSFFLRMLRLEMIENSGQSEDYQKLVTKEYASIQKTIPDEKGQLLVLCMMHKQSHFNSFSAQLFRRLTATTIGEILSVLDEATSAASVKQGELHLITCILHSLMTESRMGYSEKVFGIMAALLELNVMGGKTAEQLQADWEDYSIPKIGDEDPVSKLKVSALEEKMLSLVGLQEEVYEKECDSIQEACQKESLYSKMFWKPVTSSQDKKRMILDSYSVVLYEDIEDWVCHINNSEIKSYLIDSCLDHLGLACPLTAQSLDQTQSFQLMAREALLRDNRIYSFFDTCISSPQLNQFAVLGSNLLERDLQVNQISKFETGKNILARLCVKYSQSRLLRFHKFVSDILRAKSPYFISAFDQSLLDKSYKSMLKENQDDPLLWLAFIEIEALLEPGKSLEKIISLSKKVMATFERHKHYSRFMIIIMELYCRIPMRSPTQAHTKILIQIVTTAYSALSALGIETANFAFEKLDIASLESESMHSLVARLGVDFLSISNILSKLILSFMKISSEKPAKTTINGAFIDKRLPFRYSQFSVIAILNTLFQALAGRLDLKWTTSILQEWIKIRKTLINRISNNYAKTYQLDKLDSEIKTLCLAVCSVLRFTSLIYSIDLVPFLSDILQDFLPGDLSVTELLVEELINTKYRFQLLDEFKKHKVRFHFSGVLALMFKLQRCSSEGFKEMQNYILNIWTNKSLTTLILEDLKKDLTNNLQLQSSATTTSSASSVPVRWYDSGISIVSQQNALITLQELQAERIMQTDENKARSLLLTSIHRTPFNKKFYMDYLSLPNSPDDAVKLYSTLLEKELKVIFETAGH